MACFSQKLVFAAMLTVCCTHPVQASRVLMISVDGMKPESVLDADSHGLKVPYLRSLLRSGVYAEGVIGVWPTVTYPSHTTLVTGVTPAEHGIYTNVEFDPLREFKDSWFWYASQIRSPTVWGAVHAAGRTTASIGWPVTVGDVDIDYLIPEYWRISGETGELNPSDRQLIAAISRPEGLLRQLQASAGPYLMGNDTSVAGDEVKTRFALTILDRYKPAFMTLHLSSLDEAEHSAGIFSEKANRCLESIDAMLSRLAASARAIDRDSIVVVVSDHGFAPLTHKTNLFVPFIKAGLIETTVDAETKLQKIVSWKSEPWSAGGMAAVMLRDPNDEPTMRSVANVLQALAADANNGIESIIDREHLKQIGAFPDAAFLIVMKPGYYAATSLSGDVVAEFTGNHGGHGFSPLDPAMRASFFMAGEGIARHRNLGLIDMRQIAPSVAKALGVALPSAGAEPVRAFNEAK